MSHTLEPMEEHSPIPERRRHPRQQIRSLAYAEISNDNGGVVLNISEGGFALQAAKPLVGDGPVAVRLELPECDHWVEASGKIVWAGESKKKGAVQFVDLPEEARKEILDWISLEALPSGEFEGENALGVERPETEEVETQRGVQKVASPGPAAELVVQEQAQDLVPVAEEPAPPHATEVADAISVSPVGVPQPMVDAEFTSVAQAAPHAAGHPVQHSRRWTFAAVAAVLAVVSWIAGMAVARARLGAVAGALGLKKASPGESAPVGAGGAISAPAAPSAFQIEVVDANNRHWLLASASAAASVPAQTPRPKTPASVAAPTQKTKITAEPWAFGRPGPPPNKAVGFEGKAPLLPLLQLPDNAESALRAMAPTDSHSSLPEPAALSKASEQSSRVQLAKLLYRVEPVYPWAAKRLRVEGTVKLHATIGRDGTVQKLEPVEGLPMFTQAAMAAVRQWRYEPAILDGQPIEAEANIIIDFRLPH